MTGIMAYCIATNCTSLHFISSIFDGTEIHSGCVRIHQLEMPSLQIFMKVGKCTLRNVRPTIYMLHSNLSRVFCC